MAHITIINLISGRVQTYDTSIIPQNKDKEAKRIRKDAKASPRKKRKVSLSPKHSNTQKQAYKARKEGSKKETGKATIHKKTHPKSRQALLSLHKTTRLKVCPVWKRKLLNEWPSRKARKKTNKMG